MNEPGKRIGILTKEEIQELYSLPKFSHEERIEYFSLTHTEKEILASLRTNRSEVYFILQLGYFKAKRTFFIFSFSETKEDVHYILHRYFPTESCPDTEIFKAARLNQQNLILKLFNYKRCTNALKKELEQKAAQIVTVSAKPIYIFRELLIFLDIRKIVIPGYSFMQDLVGKALADEKNRIEAIAKQYINKEMYALLEQFFTAEHGLYEVTILKKEPKSFQWKEIISEINKKIAIKALYEFAYGFLPKLGISNENIKYYASLFEYYPVYKLKRMSPQSAYIYLLCFILNRYQKISNNLLHSLIYHVNQYTKEAKATAKDKVYEYKIEANKDLRSASKVIDLFIDKDIANKTEFGEVRHTAFNFLEKDKFQFVSRYMAKTSFDEAEYEWNHYDNLSQTFKKNLRPVILNIDFESQANNDPLIMAINFLRSVFYKNKSLNQFKADEFPQDFISAKQKRYLYEIKEITVNGKTQKIKQLNVDKYEFLVYLLLKNGLESGDVFCRDSTQFRSFEDELIDKKHWEENKNKILDKLVYPRLKIPISEILLHLEEDLETRIVEVNKRIKDGQNKHIKITGKGNNIKWSLPYKKPEDTENHSFYSYLPQISVGNVLHFVNEQCKFLEAFTHILGRYVKNEVDNHAIIACIVALATNAGLVTMGEISDISYQSLHTTESSFIRLETLRNANDMISNSIANTPFFKHYNIEKDIIHSSSDGQKFETQIKTINARHSPKYFGLKEGVTSYTLVANHVPINAKIIGANEHESHYVFDILFNNTSEIKSNLHSTDSHGVNNANSLTLYMFDYMFAPRYKNLKGKAEKICGFKNPNQYKNCLIKPVKKVKKQLVIDEADNVCRIMASLALKATTQNIIIRKLSSYTRKNKTKKAIWELDDILKSIYILNYVDDLILRQNVQRVLNRGESYHKLRRAVSCANSGKFRVKTELEQHIWNECSRLVSNCIIFYNIYILSKIHDFKESIGLQEEANFIKKISPIAWRHINFLGKYKFRQNQFVDLDKIINELSTVSVSEYSLENGETV